MYRYSVVLRNAAGREVERFTLASSGNTAANRVERTQRRATGEPWYVVRCEALGREIRR